MRLPRFRATLCCVFLALLPSLASAQGTGGPSSGDSRVGYIDPAIPGDLFRLRFDAAFNDRRPTRAEFFYPQGAPRGPGLPNPEPSVDFQELTAYFEYAPAPQFSTFVELPFRFLDPTVSPDHAGLSDVNAGFKYAFLFSEDLVTTFQFRTYAPSGDPHRGLGTGHVSLEPALLVYQRLDDRLALEGELRDWIPVGGTDFAGNIVRYGVGIHYDLFRTHDMLFTPVAEVVGWTVLDGKTNIVPPDGVSFVESAAGQTIVNAKLGLRVRFCDCADLYTGYGQPLTGNRWYENIFRLEFRLFY
jgi:hypothetical protein